MEVRFAPEKEERLHRLAAQQGRGAEELVQEAVDRMLEYETWFIAEVEKGLAQVDRGEVLDHDEVVRRIEFHIGERSRGT
jgi:predicted transcriptional regulator